MARDLEAGLSPARIFWKSPWMERLSYTMRMRRFFSAGGVFMVGRIGRAGQVEDKGGTEAGAGAAHGERAAELPGGKRATVQAEAVAGLARGEAVREDAREVFGRDAHAVVAHGDLHTLRVAGERHGDLLVGAA